MKPDPAYFDSYSYANKFKKILLEKGFKVVHSHPENKARDYFIVGFRDKKYTKFYFKFKKEFLMSFSKLFPGEKGIGESINVGVLDKIRQLNTDIVIFAHPEAFYYIYPALIKKYCEPRGLIRGQNIENYAKIGNYTGATIAVHETTYCFPAKLLQNFKEF